MSKNNHIFEKKVCDIYNNNLYHLKNDLPFVLKINAI